MAKYVFIALVIFLIIVVIGFALDLVGVKWYAFIAPQKEEARREVFENTNSYIRSKNQDLLRYYRQYQDSSIEDKKAIAEIIRIDFSNYPEENIQSLKLRAFLTKIKY